MIWIHVRIMKYISKKRQSNELELSRIDERSISSHALSVMNTRRAIDAALIHQREERGTIVNRSLAPALQGAPLERLLLLLSRVRHPSAEHNCTLTR